MEKRQTKLAKIVLPCSNVTHQKRNNFPVDRLSELPEGILESILSLLTLKEIQRTSILSRRWRYLWTFVARNLVFDYQRLLPLQNNILDVNFRAESGLVNILSFERSRFVSWVNHVLELHQGDTIDEFRVLFDMDGTFTLEIDNWLLFSLKKCVKKLSLYFKSIWRHHSNSYTLTSQLLHGYSLDSLTDLSLFFVEVSGEVLDYVLSNCPSIERLRVGCSGSLLNLKTSSPLPKLKHLEILNCNSLNHIQISAINLISFNYSGLRTTKILLGDIPNFVNLSINYRYIRYLVKNDCTISRYLSQLETLGLTFLYQIPYRLPKLLELRNLKQLKLDLCPAIEDNVCICTPLLKAFPVLNRIVLKIFPPHGAMEGELKLKRNKYPHRCLKEVELIGFVGCILDMRLALYLINKAVSLEKMIIDTQSPFEEKRLHDSIDPEKLAAITRAKQLETRLAPGVKLVIL
ncbi:hypothetical protein SO802_011819 [Lithocarpus litseifolius]|uniref:F-box domain-containing protein n=1 Tax=Lithocarpus litseifolius TaxID=425828 RepID=A0AAW2D3H5_9ROSI